MYRMAGLGATGGGGVLPLFSWGETAAGEHKYRQVKPADAAKVEAALAPLALVTTADKGETHQFCVSAAAPSSVSVCGPTRSVDGGQPPGVNTRFGTVGAWLKDTRAQGFGVVVGNPVPRPFVPNQQVVPLFATRHAGAADLATHGRFPTAGVSQAWVLFSPDSGWVDAPSGGCPEGMVELPGGGCQMPAPPGSKIPGQVAEKTFDALGDIARGWALGALAGGALAVAGLYAYSRRAR